MFCPCCVLKAARAPNWRLPARRRPPSLRRLPARRRPPPSALPGQLAISLMMRLLFQRVAVSLARVACGLVGLLVLLCRTPCFGGTLVRNSVKYKPSMKDKPSIWHGCNFQLIRSLLGTFVSSTAESLLVSSPNTATTCILLSGY